MTFEEWFNQARTREPYLNRGISQQDIWDAATKIEREACAKLSTGHSCDPWNHDQSATHVCDMVSASIGAEIRKRSNA